MKIFCPKENISTLYKRYFIGTVIYCVNMCLVCCAQQSISILAHLKGEPFFPWIESYPATGTKNSSELQISSCPSQEWRCMRYYPHHPGIANLIIKIKKYLQSASCVPSNISCVKLLTKFSWYLRFISTLSNGSWQITDYILSHYCLEMLWSTKEPTAAITPFSKEFLLR